ncbi:hypothetical protein LCGC14_1378460 [marine sediment metagenome]|uniref:Uncharacterized protein n=1 Tax=marine sediment metagenome TaxID=412755 RepID=A0A0F9MIQ4_9ZZZZ
MARKTNAEIIDRAELILEDSGNAIFLAATLVSHLEDVLTEASPFQPWEVTQQVLARSGSREIDLSGEDFLDVVDVEWPINKEPRKFRDKGVFFKRVRFEVDTPPTAQKQKRDVLLTTLTEDQTLTGTVTFTANSTAVTGSGTAFTTELKVGYYISPTSLTAWYRVAKITDDSNLVLAEVVKTADDGADTAGGTLLWYEPINVYLKKNHYAEATQTDLAGAVDLVAGYAKGLSMIHVDALGTGTMPKDMLFTIADVEGLYRITADATIASSEADIYFDPPLLGVVANDVIVTFFATSLDREMEGIVAKLLAGRTAQYWIGDARTQVDDSVIAVNTANTEFDKIGARLTQIVDTDIPAARTAASANNTAINLALGKIVTALDLAVISAANLKTGVGLYTVASTGEVETALDKVTVAIDEADEDITGVASMEELLDANLARIRTAVAATKTQLDLGVTALSDGKALHNVVPRGANAGGANINNAVGQIQLSNGYFNRIRAMSAEKNEYRDLAVAKLRNAQAKVQEAQGFISAEGTIISENAQHVATLVQEAQGFAMEARSFLDRDAQVVANHFRVLTGEIQAIQGYVSEGSSYLSETGTRTRIISALNSLQAWADKMVATAQAQLLRLVEPEETTYLHTRV